LGVTLFDMNWIKAPAIWSGVATGGAAIDEVAGCSSDSPPSPLNELRKRLMRSVNPRFAGAELKEFGAGGGCRVWLGAEKLTAVTKGLMQVKAQRGEAQNSRACTVATVNKLARAFQIGTISPVREPL
jgi:hypothetical protein